MALAAALLLEPPGVLSFVVVDELHLLDVNHQTL
jgi:hypothetical protein